MTLVYKHPSLGAIKGICPISSLVQFRALPYARIRQRFARSETLRQSPKRYGQKEDYFDATKPGSSSIQPLGSVHTDAKSNQLPTDGLEEQDQSEDCLHLTVTAPKSATSDDKLPVLVFTHGGAFFLGSSDRQYYSPLTFCSQALSSHRPLIFVSISYRLGALGFFHYPSASELVPANNGLHDQLRAFEWIHANIGGFGGDIDNITAIGQSAGAESLSLINTGGWRNLETPPYKRSILFSGTPVTMPAKSPAEYEETFRSSAQKIGIDLEDRTAKEIAQEMINAPVSKIRDLAFVGAPCSQTDLLPYDKPSIELTRHSTPPPWLESQIVSSASYDGGISYNMIHNNESRTKHAESFIKVVEDVLKPDSAASLLQLYDVRDTDEDDDALKKICQFESDVGFFLPSLAMTEAAAEPLSPSSDKTNAKGDNTNRKRTSTYFQLFDLGNPFPGPLPPGQFATHTWDIVALLGAYESHPSVTSSVRSNIQAWRDRIINYVCDGSAPWDAWAPDKCTALVVANGGVEVVERERYMGKGSRRASLNAIAESEAGERGMDVLWQEVCRRWLMQGE